MADHPADPHQHGHDEHARGSLERTTSNVTDDRGILRLGRALGGSTKESRASAPADSPHWIPNLLIEGRGAYPPKYPFRACKS